MERVPMVLLDIEVMDARFDLAMLSRKTDTWIDGP